jgi:UDP-N-acetyl-D-galactosamine dehydrogenase
LVGGHCIGVDPYYLTAKAESIGYHPHVILSGRRINDEMGVYVAQRLVKMLIAADRPVRQARVAILGVTFKENVPDIRNSRVPQIVAELRSFGVAALVHDPLAESPEVEREYGFALSSWGEIKILDALVLAVPHASFLNRPSALFEAVSPGGALLDVKSALDRREIPEDLAYWSL